MSKGSKRRPEDKKKIDKNWDKIFKGKKNANKTKEKCQDIQ
mgnify:FL=1|jgi:hypothetical protein